MATITEELQMLIKVEADKAKATLEKVNKQIETVKNTTSKTTSEGNLLATSFDDQTSSADRYALSLTTLASLQGKLAIAAIVAVKLGKEALKTAEEGARSTARLDAVLKATGRNAEISVKRVNDMASGLEEAFNADKIAIINATSALAIMDNVSTELWGKIFNTSVDFSNVVNTDLNSGIVELGKVLQDPIDKMQKLEVKGIFISDQTKMQVQALVEQNKLYEAQSILLDEIGLKVKGAAKAVADATVSDSLNTKIGNLKEAVGQNLLMNFKNSPAPLILGGTIDLLTDYFDNLLRTQKLSNTTMLDVFDMSLIELEDFVSSMKTTLENSNPLDPLYKKWKKELPVLLDILQLKNMDDEQQQEKARAAKEKANAEKAATAELENRLSIEKQATASLVGLWQSTEEGKKANLEKEIKALEEAHKLDKELLEEAKTSNDINTQFITEAENRINLYSAVIESKQKELDGLNTALPIVPILDITTKTLGKSATEYVSAIPISFDLGRTELETINEEISTVKSAINSLWTKTPAEEELEGWQTSLDVLKSKYNELILKQEELTSEAKLSEYAEKELVKLLSEEDIKTQTIADYQSKLDQLLQQKLITQEQYNRLLEIEINNVKGTSDELSNWQKCQTVIKEELGSLIDEHTIVNNLAQLSSGIFVSWGNALTSGNDALSAISNNFADFAAEITQQMSSMFISAGLRCIIEGGWAGLGIGLALIAAGGLTGITAGAIGGSGAALDNSIMNSMQKELEARKKLSDTINSSIDTEYGLLKRQLDRNIITEADFLTEADNLQRQRNIADAFKTTSQAVLDRISTINEEYKAMSGWDKFWSNRDENLKSDIKILQDLYNKIGSMGESELKNTFDKLRSLGVNLSSVPAFAEGGNFITSGPQLILVGDNPGGKEKISITPLPANSSSNQPIIYIQGDVYGWEDLYQKLQLVGIKALRRRI